MVLQRNAHVLLWGWADINEKMTIKASWLKEELSLKADKEGKWQIELKTTNSKESQSIRIKSKESDIFLVNILFGEVWLCSGQSNMQMPVKGFFGQPAYGSEMAIAKSNNPNLRLFTVDRIGSKTPKIDLEKFISWQPASPDNVQGFSAVAYYFGEQLQKILDVPVGIIHTSWGASTVQAWMSKEALNSFQNINIDDLDIKSKPNTIPTALFNAMINPIIPFKIRGALWYQGEANRKEPENYKLLFPAMVKDWRDRWAIGDFPFYYVQIAPFIYGGNSPNRSDVNSAYMREAQLYCLDSIPNSGITITIDIGDQNSIHPPKKKEVADRLLFNALKNTYGYAAIECVAPMYQSYQIKDNGIILKFKNNELGLYSYSPLESFEIAGSDKVFYPALAKIINNKEIFVLSDKVSSPIAVRYAWDNWVMGTLFGSNLLPVSSFRTDNWPDVNILK
ncbi:MAG: sialate O-acetylesterase [Saprospiraceae bacterium]|nr:sialate O-acetylesterase [Saprospiraceae bacterium]